MNLQTFAKLTLVFFWGLFTLRYSMSSSGPEEERWGIPDDDDDDDDEEGDDDDECSGEPLGPKYFEKYKDN